jgi:ATP-binding cassette subfamily B protein
VGRDNRRNSGEIASDAVTASTREALSFIISYVRRHLWAVSAGVAVLMSVDALQIVIPRIVQGIIDALGRESFSNQLILSRTLLILALAMGMVVLRFLWRLFILGSSWRIEREVREDMFGHLQRLGFSFFNRTQTGHLMALMVNDVNAVRMATGLSFLALTDALFMGALSLGFMLSINPRLTLYAVAPLPCIVFMITRFGPLIQERFKAVQAAFSDISTRTQEAFSGIRVVKGYVQERPETSGFEDTCDAYVDRNLALIRIWGFFFPAVTLFANLSTTILYLAGGRGVMTGALSFGEFVAFSMYLGLLIWPVIAIGWVVTLLQRGIASAKRILELMKQEPDVRGPEPPDEPSEGAVVSPRRVRGRIDMQGVSFCYHQGERYVLRDVTLSVPAGSSVGIMGKPGSGKSTLISLLFRLFPLREGRILLDGIHVEAIPLAVLRKSIGYVPQDPFLFSDTVAKNIAYGLDGYDPEEVARYAGLVDMDGEISSFSRGYQTLVGERGVTLSRGQKQRLSIARALMVWPRVLVLDDALSSVDAETERRVLAGVRGEMRGRTMIIVSHRVSTVQECDLIAVLEEGRVVELGGHRELAASGGYYARLYELQKLEETLA